MRFHTTMTTSARLITGAAGLALHRMTVFWIFWPRLETEDTFILAIPLETYAFGTPVTTDLMVINLLLKS
ncbi:MAG: hypothetical protein DDT25_00938 [Chloroflexi bacterium]|nr:hypothetical protein [Chloroflexota bacterium]